MIFIIIILLNLCIYCQQQNIFGKGIYGDLDLNEKIGYHPLDDLIQAMKVHTIDDLDRFEENEAKTEGRKPLWGPNSHSNINIHIPNDLPLKLPHPDANKPLLKSSAYNSKEWSNEASIDQLKLPKRQNGTKKSNITRIKRLNNNNYYHIMPMIKQKDTITNAILHGLTTHINTKNFKLQQPPTHPNLNTKYSPNTLVGCFIARYLNRTTNKFQHIYTALMKYKNDTLRYINPIACMNECGRKNYEFSGIYDARECRCGHQIPVTNTLVSRECMKTCLIPNEPNGIPPNLCGGDTSINVFSSSKGIIPLLMNNVRKPIQTHDTESERMRPTKEYRRIGCYMAASGLYRDLNAKMQLNIGVTPERCRSACANNSTIDYEFSGVSEGKDCWCGQHWPTLSKRDFSDCTTPCAGNHLIEKCGGKNTIQIYRLPFLKKNNSLTNITLMKKNITNIYPRPLIEPHHLGCFNFDTFNDKTLQIMKLKQNIGVIPRICIKVCEYKFFEFALVSNNCWCSNQYPNSDQSTSMKKCSEPCSGNHHMKKCGNNSTARIYHLPSLTNNNQSNTTSTQIHLEDYENSCYLYPGPRSLPWTIEAHLPNGVEPNSCIKACYDVGMVIAGIQNGNHCWCSQSMPHTRKLSDNLCLLQCNGNNKLNVCGGFNSVRVYHMRSNITNSILPKKNRNIIFK